VHLESVHHLERVEVPDDDISLNMRASKLPIFEFQSRSRNRFLNLKQTSETKVLP